MASTMRVVVFGGTGFVGSAIVKEAVRCGLAVTSVSRSGKGRAHVAPTFLSELTLSPCNSQQTPNV